MRFLAIARVCPRRAFCIRGHFGHILSLSYVPNLGMLAGMKLIDYLRSAEKTVAAFALELGESENTIRKIVYGQRQPSLPLAVKIAEATGGAVEAADMLQDAA